MIVSMTTMINVVNQAVFIVVFHVLYYPVSFYILQRFLIFNLSVYIISPI